MVSQAERADDLGVWGQGTGQAAREPLGEATFGGMQRAKQCLLRSVEMGVGFSGGPVDAVRYVQIDRLGAHMLAGTAIFRLAQANCLGAGLPAQVQARLPASVQSLGKIGERAGGRLSGADAPYAHILTLLA
jgi:hypothetical protein